MFFLVAFFLSPNPDFPLGRGFLGWTRAKTVKQLKATVKGQRPGGPGRPQGKRRAGKGSSSDIHPRMKMEDSAISWM